MPYAQRECANETCRRPFRPRNSRPTCWPCETEARYGKNTPPAYRECEVDRVKFVPPTNDPETKRCPSCRRVAGRPLEDNPFADFAKGLTRELPREEHHDLAPPMTQVVFDLETWGLDRGWGVTMVGSLLTFGKGKPVMKTFTLRDTEAYKGGRRSDDAELGALILNELHDAHIIYAHNGTRFDIPWLNSVALKFGMPTLVGKKVVDPCSVAFARYRIGRNSLSNLADFLGLEEQKMPVSIQTWRKALMDDDGASWDTLVQRCESDVRVLAAVAARVTRDVGMIDSRGSAFR